VYAISQLISWLHGIREGIEIKRIILGDTWSNYYRYADTLFYESLRYLSVSPLTVFDGICKYLNFR
jgi:hypothetical protein